MPHFGRQILMQKDKRQKTKDKRQNKAFIWFKMFKKRQKRKRVRPKTLKRLKWHKKKKLPLKHQSKHLTIQQKITY